MFNLKEKAATVLDDFATALVSATANPEVKSPLLNDKSRSQVVQAASLVKANASAMRGAGSKEDVAGKLQ